MKIGIWTEDWLRSFQDRGGFCVGKLGVSSDLTPSCCGCDPFEIEESFVVGLGLSLRSNIGCFGDNAVSMKKARPTPKENRDGEDGDDVANLDHGVDCGLCAPRWFAARGAFLDVLFC